MAAILENPEATWNKRFMQRHYSYRDSYPNLLDPTQPGTTTVLTELAELGLLATEAAALVPGTVFYPFGYNARNDAFTGSRFRWPNLGDYASGTKGPRGQCYAREVMINVTQDTWIRFISLNPIYLTLIVRYTTAQIAAMGVPQVITEVEHFVASGDKDTFYPTYATAIVFRADSAAGMIYISAEGNVEGGE